MPGKTKTSDLSDLSVMSMNSHPERSEHAAGLKPVVGESSLTDMHSGSLENHVHHKSQTDGMHLISKQIRKRILKMVCRSGSSHVGTALSIVDILVALYFRAMNIDPQHPLADGRDRFLLSKGHGCSALYATLAERGFCDEKTLDGFSVDNGTLWGHSTWKTMPGIEASTGSLGHGLPIGVGMALAAKLDTKKHRVFVLLGDGECDEGSVWEAALFAGHKKLDNLMAIVDYNKIQSFGSTRDVLDLEPFADKWKACKWSAREVDGHDLPALAKVLGSLPFEAGKPSVLLANTVKGKGVSFMEHSLDWHYKCPDKNQLGIALGELGDSGDSDA